MYPLNWSLNFHALCTHRMTVTECRELFQPKISPKTCTEPLINQRVTVTATGVAAQVAVLHGERHHPVRGHLLPLGARLLPALGLGREGLALHLHPALAHCVLPPPRRDHPPDIKVGPAFR